ncbi:MAG TPA: YdcF family protein [Atribacterota bacterium]|nr:YdcF family protein [Atribacterota bacterium]
MLNPLLLWRKILMQWIFPPGIIIIAILLLYFLLILRKKKAATIFLIFIVSLLFIFGSWFGEYLFLRPLEEKFILDSDLSGENISLKQPIIVVLSGDSSSGSLLTDECVSEVGEITLARLVGAYLLYKKIECPILVSGGIIPGIGEVTPAASIMGEVLMELGVTAENILKESKSSTTLENAEFTLNILTRLPFQEVILVTSAVHMPRAMLAFQNDVVTILPAPVNFLYEDKSPGVLDIFPNRSSWEHNLRAIHEWIGLIYYKIIKR